MNHRKKQTHDGRDAASLLMIPRADGTPIVTREEAAEMTAREIIETFYDRVQEEHIVPAALGRDLGWSRERINHPSNIQYLTTEDHKPKTRRDVKAYYKGERISKSQEEFRQRLLAKSGHTETSDEPEFKRKAKMPSRGFAKPPAGTKHDWKTRRRVRTDT